MLKKILLLLVILLLSSCGIWEKVVYVWQGKFFKVDTSVSKEKWELSKETGLLADAFYFVDEEVEGLSVFLDKVDEKAFWEATNDFIKEKPWIKGCYLIKEENNKVTFASTVGEEKNLDFLLIKKRFKKNYYGQSYLILSEGDLLFLKKERKDENKYIYVAICVDFKRLIQQKGNLLMQFAVVGKGKVIFTNGIGVDSLKQIDFENFIKKDFKFVLTIENNSYFCAARFIGNEPIFYVVKL